LITNGEWFVVVLSGADKKKPTTKLLTKRPKLSVDSQPPSTPGLLVLVDLCCFSALTPFVSSAAEM